MTPAARAKAIKAAIRRALATTDHASDCDSRSWAKGDHPCDCWRRDAIAALGEK